jgi:hypothetical protein
MEFVVTYLLPLGILVIDYFLTQTDKVKPNSFLEMILEFGKQIASFFMKKEKEEEKK